MSFTKEDVKSNPWLADREWVKVFNVRYPSQDIYIGVNGLSFSVQPGVPVHLPKAAIGVLNDAVETHYSREVIGPNQQRKEVLFKRFEVVPCAPPEEFVKEESRKAKQTNIVKEERKQNEIKKESDEFVASILPGEDEDEKS